MSSFGELVSNGDAIVLIGVDRGETKRRRRPVDAFLALWGTYALGYIAWLPLLLARGVAPWDGSRNLALLLAFGVSSVIGFGILSHPLTGRRVWWRFRAEQRGVVIDRVISSSCPPAEHLLDTPDHLETEEVFSLAWNHLGTVTREGKLLRIGYQDYCLDDVGSEVVDEFVQQVQRTQARYEVDLQSDQAHRSLASLVDRT